MLGSILIYSTDLDRIQQFELDNLDEYTHITLDTLTTLDLQIITDQSEVKLTESQPVSFNEDEGYALFGLIPESLDFIIKNSSSLSNEQADDVYKIQAFISEYGLHHIYEYVTF